jgi:hypothetical protein
LHSLSLTTTVSNVKGKQANNHPWRELKQTQDHCHGPAKCTRGRAGVRKLLRGHSPASVSRPPFHHSHGSIRDRGNSRRHRAKPSGSQAEERKDSARTRSAEATGVEVPLLAGTHRQKDPASPRHQPGLCDDFRNDGRSITVTEFTFSVLGTTNCSWHW